MADFLFDPLTRGLETVLDLRVQQHSLTATNLANADTPGFKARVLDFDKALESAVGHQDGLSMRRSDPSHLSGASGMESAPVVELEPAPWSEDGNSVQLERETSRMNANAILYRGVSRGLSRRLALLKYAASDGRR
ncbi:MAG: flagellar basal body rod protein FlgB [Deltaproteobacteria bacterium]|nr:flagellar basal body rod protein FlgB [Deltaproteobacteria bacterium]